MAIGEEYCEDGASDACSRDVSHGFPVHRRLPFPSYAEEQYEANSVGYLYS